MNPFKLVAYFSVFVAALNFAPTPAGAQECKCKEKLAIVDALRESSAAFVGRAEKVRPSPLRKGYVEAKFKILKRYKELAEEDGDPNALPQPKQAYFFVYTPAEKALCGQNFREGYDYLVYAKGTPAFLRTDTCDRTAVLDYVLNEVKTIENLVKKKVKEEAKITFEDRKPKR